MKFLNNLNLVGNELQNAKIQNLASAPGSPVTGQIYYDTALGYLRVWNGSAWKRLDDYTVQSVGGTAPISSSGGVTPTISISAATSGAAGSMSAADKTKLDNATNVETASTLALRDASGRMRAADPSAAQDVATKAYVDAVAQGIDVRQSVRAATTANITLSGTQTIDGVVLVANDRVLVKDQSTASANGLYLVNASAWSRSPDADTSAEVTSGMFTFVEEGTTNGDSGWVLSTDGAITLGSTALSFVQFSGGGSVTAGNGLTKTGSTLDVVGTTNRITVAADSIDIASNYAGQNTITTVGTIGTGVWTGTAIAVANGGTGATDAATARTNLAATGKYSTLIGNGSLTSITVTHNLGTRDLTISVYDATTFVVVYPDITFTSTTAATIDFAVAPTTNQYKVVVIG